MTGKGFMHAAVISIVIYIIWTFLEFWQFGEIQGDRICDNVVYVIYFMALWCGFSK